MNVYLRKLFPHDITHEVSITQSIIREYFGKTEGLVFIREGHENGRKYNVCINNATDARFGGEFKEVYREEQVKENDILAIKEIGNNLFSLSVILSGSPLHNKLSMFFKGSNRHAIVNEKYLNL